MAEIEQFHSRTEHGVRQEVFAHFTLVAMARTFGNEVEGLLGEGDGEPAMRANFKNALATLSRNFETLVLGNLKMTSDAVSEMMDSISRCIARERPGRSYPRESKRPDDRFRNPNRKSGKAEAASS